jgi:hypothetical protein
MPNTWLTNLRRASVAAALLGFCNEVAATGPSALHFGNYSGAPTPVATPIDSTNLAGKTIDQIATGELHSLLLADDGTVYSFGSNGNGRTGVDWAFGNTLIATPINTTNLAGKTISQVAAGGAHSLLLADDGTVFSFGSNEYGQTGLNTTVGNTLVATPINASNLGGKTIAQVAAGGAHSLLLADDGTVFSFGWKGNGQTGLGGTGFSNPVATPITTTNLAGKTIKQVAAGFFHSLLLADDGTVFSFGWNTNGRTGLNTSNGQTLVATPINTTNLAGRTITQIAAGGYHSLLLADDGTVFSFGLNGGGRTGLNTTTGDTLVATQIDETNMTGPRARAVAIAAGGDLSLVLAVPARGDFDGDGAIDGHDFLAWQRGESPHLLSFDDLNEWQNHYGLGTVPVTTAVPEPMNIALVLPAFVLLLRRRKRH